MKTKPMLELNSDFRGSSFINGIVALRLGGKTIPLNILWVKNNFRLSIDFKVVLLEQGK